MWDDVAKKYTNTVTGYKYTFTFDGAAVLVVKLQTNRTLSNGDVLVIRSRGLRGYQKKCNVFPRGRVRWIRTEEFVMATRRT